MRHLFLSLLLVAGLAIQAQDDCLLEAEIATTTALWGSEISWTLSTLDGTTVASGGNYGNDDSDVTTACLEDSCYVLEMLDTFGDGWNGAEITISYPTLGLMVGPFTLESGDYAALSVGLGDCSDNDWTGGGGDGGGNGGGGFDTYGCLDPAASNFDPTATIHCCCEYDIDCSTSSTLSLSHGAFGPDSLWAGFWVSYTVVGTSGFTWTPQLSDINNAGEWISEGCIADGCYTVTIHNSYPVDTTTVDILLDGVTVETVTLEPGVYTYVTSVGVNEDDCEPFVLGCTDSEAPNYNPDATLDNGTCLPPCDCPDVYEPVCGYDYFSGLTITFNNLCELECAGAYLQWEGDCSTPPVYGCMDEDALNYDPDATVDSGYCLYIPDCGEDHLVTLTSMATGLDTLGLDGNVFGSIASGYFTGLDGYVNTFVGAYDDAGNYTSYGCMADGCYNFYVYSNWSPGGSIEVSIDGGDPESFVLGADQYDGVFAFGLGVDDCEVYIPGCTDPTAWNYHPDATVDDGSCVYPFSCPDSLVAAELYVCTFSGGNQVALTITDSQGNVIYDQQGYPDLTIDYIDLCLDPTECYTATMSNIAGGTSWNGGYFWINAAGGEWANGALEGATSEDVEFGTGDDCGGDTGGNGGGNDFIYGCTDPGALNYNPVANVDDGSCLYDEPDSLDCGDLTAVYGLFFQGDPFISEVSWALLDSVGTAVLSGDGTNLDPAGNLTGSQACLEDGCYTLELYDSFGDGWGGGLLILATDDVALTFSLEEGEFASFPYEVGNGCGEVLTIWGCTDPGAMNFNPDANEDDGSCEFNFCPLIEITFVTYTFSNGEEVSWTVEGLDAAPADSAWMDSGTMGDYGIHTHTACMAAGCYTMTLHDASGDGWDQGWVEIWMDGDLMTTGTYEAGGTNSMTLGLGTDCGDDDPEVGGGTTNAGMSGWDATVDFSPFPTPTGEIVNVLGSGFDNESPVIVKVRDGIGRVVVERRVIPSAGPQGWTFDVRSWPSGIYTVDGTQGTRHGSARFVVTH